LKIEVDTRIVEPLGFRLGDQLLSVRLKFVEYGGIFQLLKRFSAKEIGTMDSKPAQNIQDTFLNTVRKDKSPITIYLVSGVKLTGKIRSFDKYSVLLENNSQEQLIFKHAISTVVSGRMGGMHGEVKSDLRTSAPTQTAAVGAPAHAAEVAGTPVR
jgi:host factor-I protein